MLAQTSWVARSAHFLACVLLSQAHLDKHSYLSCYLDLPRYLNLPAATEAPTTELLLTIASSHHITSSTLPTFR